MSAVFELQFEEQEEQRRRAEMNLLDPATMPKPAWANAGEQAKQLMQGSASAGRSLMLAGAAVPVALDKAAELGDRLGMSDEERQRREAIGTMPKPLGAADWFFEHAVDDLGQNAVDAWTPNAAETGAASNTLGTVFNVVGRVPQIIGTPGTFLLDAGMAPGTEVVQAGGSNEAALGASGVSLVTNAVGMRLPAAWGNSLATRVATGAGANVAMGAVQNKATQEILEADGLDELAASYDPTNPQAWLLDTLMGGAFGVQAHLTTPSQRAAVATANNAHHYANGTLPGEPLTAKAAIAHQDALGEAIAQVLRGDPVNVEGRVNLEDFAPRPGLAQAPAIAGYDRMLVALESGGDAAARAESSSATGLHQFTTGTWLATVKSARPEWADGLSRAELLELRTDPAKSAEMERVLRAENASVLLRAGVDATAWNLYAAHHFGSSKAVAFAKADGNTPMSEILTPGQLAANPYAEGKTKAQVIANWRKRAGDAGGLTPQLFREAHVPFQADAEFARLRPELDALDTPDDVRAGLAAEFEVAARNKPVFDAGVMAIAEELGLSRAPLLPDALKGVKRAHEKVMADYGGDASRLRDLVRGTLIVDNIGQVDAAIEAVRRTFGEPSKLRNTLRDDGTAASGAGYRDVNINVVIDGRNVELQINTPEMLAAKHEAHALYEQERAIAAEANKEGRDLTPEEGAEIERLREAMRSAYQPAWESMLRAAGPSKGEGAPPTQARNADSSMTEPLRRNESYGNGRPPSTSQAVAVAARGASDAGTSSTSANSVPAGNDSGSSMRAMSESSEASLSRQGAPDETLALEAIASNPDLQVMGEDGVIRSAADYLAEGQAEAAQAAETVRALQAAANCLLRTAA